MVKATDMVCVRVQPRSATELDPDYDVRIGEGLLDRTGSLVLEVIDAARFAVIADSNVAALYGDRVVQSIRDAGKSADLLVFPAGEANKTRQTWGELSDRMLELGHGRDSAIVALGGGVTGDLAGFVAATYMRGLPLVQIPTSLLAMIDSSVGGKTGVDTPGGKNLIGAFLQPRLVIADTLALTTLPEREVRAGLAEAVKHGAIADAAYFDWIEKSTTSLLRLESEAIARLIERSVTLKAEVVGADEREQGLRKTLNFGHTIGHAIEAASGFELLHGEAIAIGMVIEAELGEAAGVTAASTADRLRGVLGDLNLPVSVPSILADSRLIDLTRIDKKARDGRAEYALIEEIGVSSRGAGSYGTAVPDDLVVTALRCCR